MVSLNVIDASFVGAMVLRMKDLIDARRAVAEQMHKLHLDEHNMNDEGRIAVENDDWDVEGDEWSIFLIKGKEEGQLFVRFNPGTCEVESVRFQVDDGPFLCGDHDDEEPTA
jgi:hypothetical protein